MAQKRTTVSGNPHPVLETLDLTLTPTGVYTWTVQQISVSAPDAPLGSTAEFQINGATLGPLIATGDVAAGDPYVELHPGERLTVHWEGLSDSGSVGTATFIYDDGVK